MERQVVRNRIVVRPRGQSLSAPQTRRFEGRGEILPNRPAGGNAFSPAGRHPSRATFPLRCHVLADCEPADPEGACETSMGNVLDLFFADGAWWFSIPALLGTLGYLLKLLFSALGSDIAEDGFEGDSGATVLSFQGLATFAMGFGWGGLGAYRGAGWTSVTSVGVGVACGVALLGLLLMLINSTRRLQSTGNITLDRFVGIEAESYTTIPAVGGGRGQIRAIVHERQRIVNAISDGPEIPVRTPVTVVRANGDNTVTVRAR